MPPIGKRKPITDLKPLVIGEKPVSTREAMALTGESGQTIRDALDSGSLRGRKVGGSKGWIMFPSDVLVWHVKHVRGEAKRRKR